MHEGYSFKWFLEHGSILVDLKTYLWNEEV